MKAAVVSIIHKTAHEAKESGIVSMLLYVHGHRTGSGRGAQDLHVFFDTAPELQRKWHIGAK